MATNTSTTQSDNIWSRFFSGFKAVIPLIIGAFPLGIIYGALAIKAGIPSAGAQAMSAFMFAGSAQFMLAQMVSASIPAVVMILAIAVINLRHALYSATISPYFQHLSPRWKAILAFLLTDEAFVVAISDYEQQPQKPHKQWYFIGAGIGMWVFWQISTFLGISLGDIIPPSLPLDFALPLTFIAMVIPLLKDRASTGAAIAAAVIAIVAFSLPYKLSILLAAFLGILTGVLLEKRS